jgi:hypothetical protein
MPVTQQCRMCDGLSIEYQRLPENAADDMIIRVPVLIPWSKFLYEKPRVSQPVTKFLAVYGTE